ncbi:putative NUDIX hydrolase domain [Klebsormidium nitens]|uniref:NAD(+) diphosphatase n=1 Tax=Klebsormidium nitens TaxID=105231 RepID=A0A1Y1HR39_KLENI|nr:putative NUDIX hydrolase domain [Klebsormidium nitens]|eukprot:GAQ80262.1 putative NUDIX hydrolase domain [Klebsormidium nitens]
MAAVFNHVFAGNPLLPGKREVRQTQEVAALLANVGDAWFLPVSEGKPLVAASQSAERVDWELAWQTSDTAVRYLNTPQPVSSNAETFKNLPTTEDLVYVGELQGRSHYAFNVPKHEGGKSASSSGRSDERALEKFAAPSGGYQTAYLDLRTLMMATTFGNAERKEDLAIVGYARALLGWHAINQYCGKCGTKTASVQFGLRRVCQQDSCRLKLYPRIDPVVIMCVVDKERDVILLGRGARHPNNMYSCLAGFIEPGESLEEAVRRETREEVGIEIGDVVHHSSQPWPVGFGTQQCQLMVGFFAFAKTVEINVDEAELADARWFTRSEVRAAFSEEVYGSAQRDAQEKIAKACFDRVEGGEAKIADLRGRTEPSALFVPGAYAIAHHLILAWLNKETGKLLSRV